MWKAIRNKLEKWSGRLAIFFGFITLILGGTLVLIPATLPFALPLILKGVTFIAFGAATATGAVFILQDNERQQRQEQQANQQEQERMQHVTDVVVKNEDCSTMITPVTEMTTVSPAEASNFQKIMEARLATLEVQVAQLRDEQASDRELHARAEIAMNQRIACRAQEASFIPTTPPARPSAMSMFQRQPRRVGLTPPAAANEQTIDPVIPDETMALTS